ncbi:hypothetical protein ACH3VR_14470 [Microbacterium sp. B2969]|uniref:Uncharacterized protein n=1 Tax=Microbacterium alkaliflavum TaxID=3248839 RepID=A0ABW7Q9K9_9MICO
MRATLIAVGAVMVVGLGLVVWLLAPEGGRMLPQASEASSAPTATAGPSSTSAAAATPPAGATPGPVPGATPVAGSEVLPPSSAPDASEPLIDAVRPVKSDEPLVKGDLPPTAASTGKLVDGFPKAAAPAPESDVIQSSIATEGGVMQVALVARTDESADDITAHYRDMWKALGLADHVTTNGLQFADSFTTLSLAFTAGSGTGTVYTVYGVFHTS